MGRRSTTGRRTSTGQRGTARGPLWRIGAGRGGTPPDKAPEPPGATARDLSPGLSPAPAPAPAGSPALSPGLPAPGGAGADSAEDVHWAGERRSAVGAAVLLLTSLLVLDTGAGRITPVRAALWTGLGALLFVILLPPRVRARPGLLTSRGLYTTHSVRTDALVSVRWSDGVARRLVLRDRDGGRVEIDPDVLVRNPALWHRLDTDSRTALRRGTLLCGATALRRLSQRIDREAARTVFKVSGLV